MKTVEIQFICDVVCLQQENTVRIKWLYLPKAS